MKLKLSNSYCIGLGNLAWVQKVYLHVGNCLIMNLKILSLQAEKSFYAFLLKYLPGFM